MRASEINNDKKITTITICKRKMKKREQVEAGGNR